MTLEETIKTVRNDFGDDIVTSNRFMGALKDYRAFDDEELYVENIFVRIVADRHIKEILSWKRCNAKKYLTNSDSMAEKIARKYALQEDVVLDVIHKVSIGLGIIDVVPNGIPANTVKNFFSAITHQPSPANPVCTTNTNSQNSPQSVAQQQTSSFDLKSRLQKEDTHKWRSIVREYPIPSDRDDFIQLVKFLKENSNEDSDDYFVKACNEKLKECRQRAMVIFADDFQMSKMLSYGKYEKTKKSVKVLVGLAIVAFVITSMVLMVSKCSRERTEKNAAAAVVFRNNAKARIDAEEHRLDSLVVNLPKPTRSNYMLCANKVQAIVWYKVDCGGYQDIIDYQNEKRNKMRSRVNEYIFKLQQIEPNEWNDNYTENDRFVKNVEDWSVFRSW